MFEILSGPTDDGREQHGTRTQDWQSMTEYTPTTPRRLTDDLAERVTGVPGIVVVGVDGAAAARPELLAAAVADGLRSSGRPATVVDLHDFLRPASLRLERGHDDPVSYREAWFDHAAVHREVIDAVRTRGTWLPRLWDPVADRSFRDRHRDAADDQVLLIAGPMLLDRGHRFDLSVALRMGAGTLRRRTPEPDLFTVEPLLAHVGAADIEVRYDHPDRPAVAGLLRRPIRRGPRH